MPGGGPVGGGSIPDGGPAGGRRTPGGGPGGGGSGARDVPGGVGRPAVQRLQVRAECNMGWGPGALRLQSIAVDADQNVHLQA